MKYIKKPIPVEAVQLTRKFFDLALDLVPKEFIVTSNSGEFAEDACYIEIKTAIGVMEATENYWIIRGDDGKGGFHVWPVSPEYFEHNYEKCNNI